MALPLPQPLPYEAFRRPFNPLQSFLLGAGKSLPEIVLALRRKQAQKQAMQQFLPQLTPQERPFAQFVTPQSIFEERGKTLRAREQQQSLEERIGKQQEEMTKRQLTQLDAIRKRLEAQVKASKERTTMQIKSKESLAQKKEPKQRTVGQFAQEVKSITGKNLSSTEFSEDDKVQLEQAGYTLQPLKGFFGGIKSYKIIGLPRGSPSEKTEIGQADRLGIR